MPANLNALIRYKQIDKCLNNPYLKASISVLQEKCSEQLGEHRGIYKLVSERTIREDIRVMRSDALEFNAPIVVNKGIYSYSESNYSLFNNPINDVLLLKEIYQLLLNEKDTIKSSKLNEVLKQLKKIKGVVDLPLVFAYELAQDNSDDFFIEGFENNTPEFLNKSKAVNTPKKSFIKRLFTREEKIKGTKNSNNKTVSDVSITWESIFSLLD